MMFTDAERRLLLLFDSEPLPDTLQNLRQALPDIYEPHERTVAVGLISKLEGMSEAALHSLGLEGGVPYAG